MGLLGLHLIARPLHRQAEGGGVDVVVGDAGAQHGFVQPPGFVQSEAVGGDLAQRAAGAGIAHGPDHGPLVRQQVFGHVPAAVQRAHQILFFHAHVVEEGLAEGRLAADQGDGPRRHARRRHVEQHEADAQVLWRLGVGADQAEDPVGLVGVGGPDLLAVDDPVVAAILGAGLDRGEVGPGARLGIALAPADLAAHDGRQETLLLLLRAEGQQRRTQHPDAEAGQRQLRLEAAHLGGQHLGLLAGKPAAAVCARPFRRGPAARGHAVQPQLVRGGLEHGVAAAPDVILVAVARTAHLGRAVRLQPGARLGAERLQIGHGRPPSRSSLKGG
ncbi:hypothetical protein D3C77_159840 [compost metagenome]